MDFLYFDNNATTRPAPEVAAAMDEVQREAWANPSSVHRLGQIARQRIELARRAIATLVGSRPRQITLTGSGTEALDLAIRGGLRAKLSGQGGAARLATDPARRFSVVTTRAEHSAVRELATDLERFGLDGMPIRIHWAPMTAEGIVDANAVRSLLESDPSIALVSIQWANNETGAIQPVQEIARACLTNPVERGGPVLFHCDATQWVGKMPTRLLTEPAIETDLHALHADFVTFSSHKFHGPKGLGVLWSRPGARFAPMILGEQELGRRGGTENTAAITGAGIAASLAEAWLGDPRRVEHGRLLRDRFERGVLAAAIAAGVDASVNGPPDPALRLWNTSNIAFTRLEAEALLLLLSERGVCCSAGAACSSGSLEPSSVLIATGIPPERAHGSLRFSLSRETTVEEVERAIQTIGECVTRLRTSAANLL